MLIVSAANIEQLAELIHVSALIVSGRTGLNQAGAARQMIDRTETFRVGAAEIVPRGKARPSFLVSAPRSERTRVAYLLQGRVSLE